MVTKKVHEYFGEILIRSGRLDSEKLGYALSVQRNNGCRGLTGQILIDSGYIREEDVTFGLVAQYGFPFLPLDEYDVDSGLTKILPEEFAQKHGIVPVEKTGNSLSIAMSNPLERKVVKEIREFTKCHVSVFICTKKAIQNKIELLYEHKSKTGGCRKAGEREGLL